MAEPIVKLIRVTHSALLARRLLEGRRRGRLGERTKERTAPQPLVL